MFMDEARFGRISTLRQCWAPAGTRPVVPKQVVREWTYAYAAVSPHDGAIVFAIHSKANTGNMTDFMTKVASRFAEDRILMVMDGAGWHKAKALVLPVNIHRIFLPPYSPELNPAEHVWDHMRENEFANRVYATLAAVEVGMNTGLSRLSENPGIARSLCGFDWIVIMPLKAD
jgi:transposase